MGRPPKAKPAAPGFSRAVALRNSAGGVRVELVAVNIFDLTGRDRDLVFAIADLFDAYEGAGTVDPLEPARE